VLNQIHGASKCLGHFEEKAHAIRQRTENAIPLEERIRKSIVDFIAL